MKKKKYRKMWTRERDISSRLIRRWKNTVKMKEVMRVMKGEKKNVHQRKVNCAFMMKAQKVNYVN